ncbi:uncharacterized protein LOC110682735 [Chenopodium quinoa]|uniref:uncharacterized protein LOC110682735 n=1 Tax=Chenopodium quinoa TaxID=63459 RepID=UPI000B7813C3|nr:uncharacterized protein LOC110682735 [Chenopodium quinoa]
MQPTPLVGDNALQSLTKDLTFLHNRFSHFPSDDPIEIALPKAMFHYDEDASAWLNKQDVKEFLRANKSIPTSQTNIIQTSYRLKQNKLDKINVLRTEAEANESIPGNHDTSKPPVYEESRQNVDIEQAGTKNHTIRDKSSQRLKKVTTLTPADKDDNKVSTVIEDQREKLIPGEVQIMHQITEKDVQEECDNNSCNQQQKHQEPIKMVKQEPLTEDELFLK